jgi:hypothetical protein
MAGHRTELRAANGTKAFQLKIALRYLVPPIWRRLLRYPACLAGARACPPDDCGGPPGYERLVDALRDPTQKANAELLEWCGDWNPETFDLEFVNRMISP